MQSALYADAARVTQPLSHLTHAFTNPAISLPLPRPYPPLLPAAKKGLSLPLLIGGATTSRMHTAVKLSPQVRGVSWCHIGRFAAAPLSKFMLHRCGTACSSSLHPPPSPLPSPSPLPQYGTVEHPVIHVLDASRSVVVVSSLLDPNKERRSEYVQDVSTGWGTIATKLLRPFAPVLDIVLFCERQPRYPYVNGATAFA